MSEDVKYYIHHGGREFSKELFTPVHNVPLWTKPTGGLWASPLEPGSYGWAEWCRDEGFRKYGRKDFFTFRLTDNARVLTIKQCSDLRDLPGMFKLYNEPAIVLDFELLMTEYDAIEVYAGTCGYLNSLLMTWDCDSILVMNPDVVIQD